MLLCPYRNSFNAACSTVNVPGIVANTGISSRAQPANPQAGWNISLHAFEDIGTIVNY